MKVAVIIPCYNESKSVGALVAKAKKYADEVIVVDNGSYDKTSVEALNNGASVKYSHRKGMGAAIYRGVKKVEADIYVTMDGDGQHNADEIPVLLESVISDKADLVVGIRHSVGIPRYRYFGNWVLTQIYNFGSPFKLEDVQCGFRAFNKNVRDIPISSSGFGCVFELLVKARKLNYRIKPVDITCVYFKDFKRNSTMNPIKHGLIAACGALKWRLWELF